ncbi:GGDEF domain-containing protein [Luteimonas sp. Y-2-2-4F]|nr:GGDEF domain-containing protein [Luteimonas sp. Y-2-2-4F]MCD9030491.1 GGDEF domain-containing protein [Luteimonas sp. Y-2-2-4F]
MTEPSLRAEDDPSPRLAAAWRRALADADPAALALARGLAEGAAGFADRFYATLLDDPRAARFLSHEQVRERLHPALQRWLRALLHATPESVDALIGANRQAGIVHARIGMPVDLVGRGIRVLRGALLERIRADGAAPGVAFAAVAVVDASIDLALECMTLAYADAHDRSSRTDAAYRLFSLAQNIGAERERQRALLLDWENRLLYALAGNGRAAPPRPLSESEFGLWFLHKGIPIIGDNGETRHVRTLMAEIDGLMGPDALPSADAFEAIRARLDAVRELLTLLFGRIGELEAGSDALTRLLNRRFLPTVLRTEIELAASHRHEFAVLLLDVDHFKRINDEHGHDTGDRALQHLAGLLTQAVRSSDYVFRLGGEEFLIVLVAVGAERALAFAETLRERIAATPLPLADGRRLPMSASIGVAPHDGHPDYERLLVRADRAMYAAKRGGRDRVELAEAFQDMSA